jgi:hypothetical protein
MLVNFNFLNPNKVIAAEVKASSLQINYHDKLFASVAVSRSSIPANSEVILPLYPQVDDDIALKFGSFWIEDVASGKIAFQIVGPILLAPDVLGVSIGNVLLNLNCTVNFKTLTFPEPVEEDSYSCTFD